ncbi:Embryonic stem cell-specific 5-hydroxymethylcytosine-binding protein [Mucuna pruriens]|uniref:Embryonic stem cell-specific 5-hydroxymethylcytosine-binding protein n=1 Tax=Mucuna pruriens TaxID=157652 RepID=A0A371GR33_MUCPR|nr:Embryonic stem cell-specific 5-hydroxymethylcytosine-binding protein [Mucuna pruriens]
MCGRARCTLRADDVPRACHRSAAPTRTLYIDRPAYNVSPGSDVPVVRREDASDSEGYVLHCMKWGLIPSFTKKTEKPDHYRMFNARSESIDEKASFRRLLPKSRCLVAVEGFYEWKKDGSRKQPYYIHFKDGRPLVFAAFYDSWQNSEGETLYTFTIVTTSSSSALQWLHDRMPVILGSKDSTDTWLSSSSSSFKSVLKPYEESDLVWYPVTAAMGKPSFDGPECIKEIQVKSEGNTSISKFFSRKGTESEDTKPGQKISCPEFVKTEHTEDLGEGAKPEGENDLKFSGSSHSQNASILPIKREYETFSADSKPALANHDQISSNPAKKKEKTKTANDNQPTLFSYFGKSFN